MVSVNISVREYDIGLLSDNLPGSYSHIVFHWSDGRDYNFGPVKNNEYQYIGEPFDPTDRIGGSPNKMPLDYRIAKDIEVDKSTADIYYDAIKMFDSDLLSKNIGYKPTPFENMRQATLIQKLNFPQKS